ncbi:MAG TPA: hypothetical protein VFX16_08975 [Pseudonocardiaceae bacterium]|nr:hypothetical protein [Pseudonocardiaceae bacterium]
MDPRERADAALARARSRGVFVVTPDDAVSPMDASSTVQIPRSVVQAADHRDESDSTMVIPAGVARGQAPPQQQPPPGYQQRGGQYQTGPHQPVPYPGYPPQSGQYQSGQHQAVPQPPVNNGWPEQQPPQQRHDDPQPTPRQLDGLVPTTQQPSTQRSSMSRRLDGQ